MNIWRVDIGVAPIFMCENVYLAHVMSDVVSSFSHTSANGTREYFDACGFWKEVKRMHYPHEVDRKIMFSAIGTKDNGKARRVVFSVKW